MPAKVAIDGILLKSGQNPSDSRKGEFPSGPYSRINGSAWPDKSGPDKTGPDKTETDKTPKAAKSRG